MYCRLEDNKSYIDKHHMVPKTTNGLISKWLASKQEGVKMGIIRGSSRQAFTPLFSESDPMSVK